MIFPVITSEDTIQVGDKFRVMLDKSYRTPEEAPISKVEIQMEAAGDFFDVTGDLTKPNPQQRWGIDYQYATDGTKVITARVTCGISPSEVVATASVSVSVITAAEDNLFSTDEELKQIQDDIYKLLPGGRSSFKFKHRAAQDFILDWLFNNGYFKRDELGNASKYEKSDVVTVAYISDWSAYVTLRMIYQANSSNPGDIFEQKAGVFQNFEERAREKVLLKLDDTAGSEVGLSITSRRFQRV